MSWGGGAAGEAGNCVPRLGPWRPFLVLVRIPKAGASVLEASASCRVRRPALRREGRRASGASRSSATPILSALPSVTRAPDFISDPTPACQCLLQACHCPQNFWGPSGLSRPRILSVFLGPPSASQAFRDPPNPFRIPPGLIPAMPVPGLPVFPRTVSLASPAVVLNPVKCPGLLVPSPPPGPPDPHSSQSPSQLRRGSPTLSESPILLVTHYLARAPKPFRTPLPVQVPCPAEVLHSC